MVCKEDLCFWFKTLHPSKRIDIMCGLLHMCLPLEIRFVGTVLEDYGKKDYSYLRNQEFYANKRDEIEKFRNVSSPEQLRSKIFVTLALLRSSSTSCAHVLYEIMDNKLDSVFSFSSSDDSHVIDEILTILTLAVNHPAFLFEQRRRFHDHLSAVCKKSGSIMNKVDADELQLELPSKAHSPNFIVDNVMPVQTGTLCNRHSTRSSLFNDNVEESSNGLHPHYYPAFSGICRHFPSHSYQHLLMTTTSTMFKDPLFSLSSTHVSPPCSEMSSSTTSPPDSRSVSPESVASVRQFMKQLSIEKCCSTTCADFPVVQHFSIGQEALNGIGLPLTVQTVPCAKVDAIQGGSERPTINATIGNMQSSSVVVMSHSTLPDFYHSRQQTSVDLRPHTNNSSAMDGPDTGIPLSRHINHDSSGWHQNHLSHAMTTSQSTAAESAVDVRGNGSVGKNSYLYYNHNVRPTPLTDSVKSTVFPMSPTMMSYPANGFPTVCPITIPPPIAPAMPTGAVNGIDCPAVYNGDTNSNNSGFFTHASTVMSRGTCSHQTATLQSSTVVPVSCKGVHMWPQQLHDQSLQNGRLMVLPKADVKPGSPVTPAPYFGTPVQSRDLQPVMLQQASAACAGHMPPQHGMGIPLYRHQALSVYQLQHLQEQAASVYTHLPVPVEVSPFRSVTHCTPSTLLDTGCPVTVSSNHAAVAASNAPRPHTYAANRIAGNIGDGIADGSTYNAGAADIPLRRSPLLIANGMMYQTVSQAMMTSYSPAPSVHVGCQACAQAAHYTGQQYAMSLVYPYHCFLPPNHGDLCLQPPASVAYNGYYPGSNTLGSAQMVMNAYSSMEIIPFFNPSYNSHANPAAMLSDSFDSAHGAHLHRSPSNHPLLAVTTSTSTTFQFDHTPPPPPLPMSSDITRMSGVHTLAGPDIGAMVPANTVANVDRRASCYNCGSRTHRAPECSMENMSGNAVYALVYHPNGDYE